MRRLFCWEGLELMSEQTTAVKILEQADDTVVVGGYGVIFGGRDLEGETFTPDTDYQLGRVPVKAVYYDHTKNDAVQHVIGQTIEERIDDVGIWVQAQLDRATAYAEEVIKLIEAGALGWSSGSVAHLTRRSGGVIKSWPVYEYSLTPTPAEPRTVGVARLKALVESDPALKAMLAEVAQDSDGQEAAAGEDETPTIIEPNEDKKMTEEVKEINNVYQAPPAVTLEEIKALVQPLAERLQAIENKPQPAPAVAEKSAPNVILDTKHWKYDNVGAGDIAFLIETLASAKRNGRSRRGVSDAAYKALAMRLESEEVRDSAPLQVAATAMKMAGVKANEIAQSTLANYGDEWVGVAYSGQLWEAIRHETFVLNNLPQMEVPAGAESVVIPLEGTDPTWYKVGQSSGISANPGGVVTNTVTASTMGTDNQTMTLAKLGARVLWTGEMEEDSVLPYVPQLQRQLVVSGSEYVEAAVIDGDTATGASTNINAIDTTPTGYEYFLTVNGFRKSPLITTTANSRDGAALTVEDWLETVKLMGSAGKNALDRNKVAFIIDPSTHWKALQLAEFKTQDVFTGATIEGGLLTKVWGYPQYLSAHMCKISGTGLSNAAGAVDADTAGNNTKGQILAVRWDQWLFGWRRRMTIETTRVAAADATEIVALMRFGLTQRDTEASAISFNLTV
jgi:phage head maturation protease